jgi:hypothetical protein
MIRNFAYRVTWVCLWAMLVAPSVQAERAVADGRLATELADSLGVNTHMGVPEVGSAGTSYGNVQSIGRELAFVGIRHVRDSLLIGPNIGKLDTLHQQLGVRFLLVYDDYTHASGSVRLRAALSSVAYHRDLLDGIEGPNEPDQFGLHYNGLSGAAAATALQTELYRTVKADPRLQSVPVYCPALSFPAPGGLADRLGNLAPVCDVASAHVYVENHTLGAQMVDEYIARWSAFPAVFVPGRPRVITEGGWLTTPDHVDGVDEPTQARYILTYLLDAFSGGIQRTYIYDLSDSGSETFGLFHADGTPKPAAAMLAKLQTLLDCNCPSGEPGTSNLSYTIDKLPEHGHHLLLRRSDGAFILALWREVVLWDRRSHVSISVAPARISVHLNAAPRRVELVDLFSEPGTDAPHAPRQDITLALPGHPVFLLLH